MLLPPAPVNGEAGILAPGRIRQLVLNKQRKTGGWRGDQITGLQKTKTHLKRVDDSTLGDFNHVISSIRLLSRVSSSSQRARLGGCLDRRCPGDSFLG